MSTPLYTCDHTFYQSQVHGGKWKCIKCPEVIEGWQHHNLVMIERDQLRQHKDRLKEFIDSVMPELPSTKQREARELFKL